MIIENVIGLPQVTSIAVGTMVVIAYTVLGGMWAVSLTDFIQMVIIILGLGLIIPFIGLESGGFGELWSNIPKKNYIYSLKVVTYWTGSIIYKHG